MITFYNTEKFSFPKEDPIAIKQITNFINKLKKEKLPFSTLDFIDDLFQELENLQSYFSQFQHLLSTLV